MDNRLEIAICGAFCLILCLTASLSPAATITATTLPNGMQVRILADENLSLTRVGMFFAAGRANDPDSLGGLAHLAEHFLTESSPAYPDGGLIRQSTLYSTYRNAYTSSGFMQFDTQCLPEYLPRILALEVERLRGCSDNEISFAREKMVVLEELAYRKRRSPFAQHLEDLFHACYRSHPFGEEIGGTPESVARITLTDFQAFRERNIVPHRAALVISGPVDPEQIAALVDSLFDLGQPAQPAPLTVPPFPPIGSVQIITDSAEFTGVKVTLAFRIPIGDDGRDGVIASFLPYLMDPTRVHFGVYTVPGEKLIYTSAHYSYSRMPRDLAPTYTAVAEVFDPDQTAQRVMGYLWQNIGEEISRLGKGDNFAEQREVALRRAANPTDGMNAGTIMVNGANVLDTEDIRAILTDLTAEDVADFGRRFITSDRAAVGITHGSDSERQQSIDLAKRVASGEAAQSTNALASLTAAEIEPVLAAYAHAELNPVALRTLNNGIPVAYLELPGLTEMRLGGCRVLSPLKVQRLGGKPGLVNLYNLVVDWDDRQRRDPNDEIYRFKRLPYKLDFTLEPGLLRFRVRGPQTKTARLAFHLDRRLESHEFHQSRWFKLTLSGPGYLTAIATNPEAQSWVWRMSRIFGADYYDLGFWQPDPDTVDRIRYKDLVKLHKATAGKTGQMVLYGVGSVPVDDVMAALAKDLGRRDKYRPFTDDPPAVVSLDHITGRVISDLTRGDVMLRLSFPLAPGAADSGPAADLVLETLLSQSLQARLRETDGLTYAAWATADRVSGRTLWETHVTCQPGQAHLVMAAMRNELRRYTTSGFTADEVARARLAMTGHLVRKFSDQVAAFALLAELATYGPMPPDLLGNIAALTQSGINDLAKQVLSADRFAFTAVGPMFEEDLEEFDLR